MIDAASHLRALQEQAEIDATLATAREATRSVLLRALRQRQAVRLAHTGGWRWGFVCGAVAGLFCAAVLWGGALQAGLLAGAQ